jgi:hypothetical protein
MDLSAAVGDLNRRLKEKHMERNAASFSYNRISGNKKDKLW